MFVCVIGVVCVCLLVRACVRAHMTFSCHKCTDATYLHKHAHSSGRRRRGGKAGGGKTEANLCDHSAQFREFSRQRFTCPIAHIETRITEHSARHLTRLCSFLLGERANTKAESRQAESRARHTRPSAEHSSARERVTHTHTHTHTHPRCPCHVQGFRRSRRL